MGLVFLFAILLYFALLVAATVLGYRYGAKRGWAPGKRRLAAIAGFLIVFLPMFWDWLPTVWLHAYYCDTDAGLTINKTPEQWKQENPGVAETLVRQTPPLQVGSRDNFYLQLNQRFRWEIKNSEMLLWLMQHEESVVDGNTGVVLVRFVDFSTGQGGEDLRIFRNLKIWMYRNSCQANGKMTWRGEFNQLSLAYETIGGR